MKYINRNRRDGARACLLVILLAMGVLVVQPWQPGGVKAAVTRQGLKEMPGEIGDWKKTGMDQRFDRESEGVLNSDDYILRNFETPENEKVSLFVGYYENVEFSSNWHSPTVCLPGTGWSLIQRDNLQIPATAHTPAFEANTYVIQKGKEQLVMLYWFQGRGRFLASTFWTKFYSTFDSLKHRRSDGAIVRVVTPILNSEAEALNTAREFATQVSPLLSPYVPQ